MKNTIFTLNKTVNSVLNNKKYFKGILGRLITEVDLFPGFYSTLLLLLLLLMMMITMMMIMTTTTITIIIL